MPTSRGAKNLAQSKGRSIGRFIGRVFDKIESKHKKMLDHKRDKNLKMIKENWGSYENYSKTY